jgi:hypothetical protein
MYFQILSFLSRLVCSILACKPSFLCVTCTYIVSKPHSDVTQWTNEIAWELKVEILEKQCLAAGVAFQIPDHLVHSSEG